MRLDWGYLDEWRSVGWNVGALPRLRELLDEAKESGKDLEIVFDSAPGWEEPWSRGERARVIGEREDRWNREYVVELVDSGVRRWVRDEEVFAARLFPEVLTVPPAAAPLSTSSTAESDGDESNDTFAWPDERDDRVS